jgi:hypothetical protein
MITEHKLTKKIRQPGYYAMYLDNDKEPGKNLGPCAVCGMIVRINKDCIKEFHHDGEQFEGYMEVYHGRCYAPKAGAVPVEKWGIAKGGRKYDPNRKRDPERLDIIPNTSPKIVTVGQCHIEDYTKMRSTSRKARA